MTPYSPDLRQRILETVQQGAGSLRQIAQRFLVSLSFVVRLLQTYRRTGSIQPRPHRGGNPAKLGPEDLERLRELVRQQPDATLEELRQRLSRMADTQEIEKALGEFLADLVTPLLEHHAYTPSHHVSVSVRRTSSPRIGVGDWVEYKGGYKRVSEQIGGERSLGRVIGEDMLRRPRVRWYSGNEWLKPYSLFDQFSVSVLFDFQAAERYPEAFNGYPKET